MAGEGLLLQDRLNLTADQSTQIKAILDDDQTKLQALRANTALAPDDRRSQSMALRNDENTKIEAVLTADQKTQYEQILAQQRDRMRNGGGPGGPGGDGSAPPPPPPPVVSDTGNRSKGTAVSYTHLDVYKRQH